MCIKLYQVQSCITSKMQQYIYSVKKMIKKRNILIEVDGGINSLNAKDCVSAGADILVAGTAVFKGGNYQKNIESLR